MKIEYHTIDYKTNLNVAGNLTMRGFRHLGFTSLSKKIKWDSRKNPRLQVKRNVTALTLVLFDFHTTQVKITFF